MHRELLFLSIVLAVLPAFEAAGAVELDEFTFDKVTGKFKASLVKFDVAYPYGDKHEAFTEFAKEAKDVDDLLVVDVGVKDYGEKDNEALAKKYGAHKDNFPLVKLFIKGIEEPITFDGRPFTTDELRKFVREQSGLYLSLPGCVKELDMLTSKFLNAPKNEREKVLNELKEVVAGLDSKLQASGKIYKLIMEKTIEKGDDFIKAELQRVKKLLSQKVAEEKKKELQTRLNIIQSFQLASKKVADEL